MKKDKEWKEKTPQSWWNKREVKSKDKYNFHCYLIHLDLGDGWKERIYYPAYIIRILKAHLKWTNESNELMKNSLEKIEQFFFVFKIDQTVQ